MKFGQQIIEVVTSNKRRGFFFLLHLNDFWSNEIFEILQNEVRCPFDAATYFWLRLSIH